MTNYQLVYADNTETVHYRDPNQRYPLCGRSLYNTKLVTTTDNHNTCKTCAKLFGFSGAKSLTTEDYQPFIVEDVKHMLTFFTEYDCDVKQHKYTLELTFHYHGWGSHLYIDLPAYNRKAYGTNVVKFANVRISELLRDANTKSVAFSNAVKQWQTTLLEVFGG